MLFYGPYNRHKMKIHMKQKTIEQQNQVLPQALQLKGDEDHSSYMKRYFHGKSSQDGKSKIWNTREETKKLLAKVAMKNAEENLEFIDEIKTNIVQNQYMAKKLKKFQRKLLPLAYVNKIALDFQNGNIIETKKSEEDIVKVFKKFRSSKEEESEEMKKIRKYILENASFLVDFENETSGVYYIQKNSEQNISEKINLTVNIDPSTQKKEEKEVEREMKENLKQKKGKVIPNNEIKINDSSAENQENDQVD